MLKIRLPALKRALLLCFIFANPGAADPPAGRAAAAMRDWRLDCASGSCVARAALRGGDGSELLAVEARGPAAAGILALRTPLPLFLPDGAVMAIGEAAPVPLPWRTCGPAGCVAETAMTPELLSALKRGRAAAVTFTLVEGVRVRVPVSLLGFTAAWTAAAAVLSP